MSASGACCAHRQHARASGATTFSCIAHHARCAKGHRRLQKNVRPADTSTPSGPDTLRAGVRRLRHASARTQARLLHRTGCPRGPAAQTAPSPRRPWCAQKPKSAGGGGAGGGQAAGPPRHARNRQALTWLPLTFCRSSAAVLARLPHRCVDALRRGCLLRPSSASGASTPVGAATAVASRVAASHACCTMRAAPAARLRLAAPPSRARCAGACAASVAPRRATALLLPRRARVARTQLLPRRGGARAEAGAAGDTATSPPPPPRGAQPSALAGAGIDYASLYARFLVVRARCRCHALWA